MLLRWKYLPEYGRASKVCCCCSSEWQLRNLWPNLMLAHQKCWEFYIKWKNKIFPYYPEGIISNSIHISKLNLTSICEMRFEVFFAFGFLFLCRIKTKCITDFSCSSTFQYKHISRIQYQLCVNVVGSLFFLQECIFDPEGGIYLTVNINWRWIHAYVPCARMYVTYMLA